MKKTPTLPRKPFSSRKWFGLGLLAIIVLGLVWHFSPGLPVLFGPWASASTKQAGLDRLPRRRGLFRGLSWHRR